jgi:hypothetical protein
MLCGAAGGTAPPDTVIQYQVFLCILHYASSTSYTLLRNLLYSVSLGGPQNIVWKHWRRKKKCPTPIGNKIPIVQYLA